MTEASLRNELAAAYRVCHYYGWDELIYNHITVRVPGPDRHFLINPFGFAFDEVTPSNLVKVDLQGNLIGEQRYAINPAGYVIHSAIHSAREDLHCVVHLHTPNGVAISTLEEGLPHHTQTSMAFFGKIAYHDYEGIALNNDERARLVADLGEKKVLILRNHGVLTAGETIAEAMSTMFFLERACQAELLALSTGRPLRKPQSQLLELISTQEAAFNLQGKKRAEIEFASMLRRIKRLDPKFEI